MRTGRWIAAALAAAIGAAGCGSGQTAKPKGPPAPVMARGVAVREPAANPRPYGAADTAFGLDLLGAWCRAEPQANLVLSPSSLASALGMAYLGARGGAARAMAAVLHLPAASGQALEAGLQARSTALRAIEGPGVTLQASDQVWADPTLITLRSYLNAVATGYGAGVAHVPLLTHPEQAAQQINQAIASATRGQIPKLVSPDMLQNIGWLLTDALYLKAAWDVPFDPKQTVPGPFTTAAGQRVPVRFMNGGPYRTVTAAGWTAVRLPYRGGRLAMLALLGPRGTTGAHSTTGYDSTTRTTGSASSSGTTGSSCALPTAATLGTITARLAAGGPASPGATAGFRDVELPRASISDHASMKDLLGELGMGPAFSPSADFTGLSPEAGRIRLVQHAAALRVGERGTVASAATAVGLEPTAGRLPLPRVVFDRPYLMLVTDSATGEPLFLARVANPAAQ